MENPNSNESFIRNLVGKKGLETPGKDFTDKVMAKIQAQHLTDETPLFSKGTWIAIFLAAAAVIVSIFTIDLAFMDRIFSSARIQKVSMDVFSDGFLQTMSSFIEDLDVSGISVAILLASTGLIILERVIRRRFADARLFLFGLFV